SVGLMIKPEKHQWRRHVLGPRRHAAWVAYRSREDGGGPGVAHSSVPEGSPAVSGTGVLLQAVCQEFHRRGESIAHPDKERSARPAEACTGQSPDPMPPTLRPYFPGGCGCQQRLHQGTVVSTRGARPTGVVAYANRSLYSAERSYCDYRRDDHSGNLLPFSSLLTSKIFRNTPRRTKGPITDCTTFNGLNKKENIWIY
ncbi:conserved hypothetical protein, partial [Trichinella spiralis]|uniref:hypothetical protein n=1 Tax=Trichinella spiralis TaxID=6334 RepID=UPI0001EFD8AA